MTSRHERQNKMKGRTNFVYIIAQKVLRGNVPNVPPPSHPNSVEDTAKIPINSSTFQYHAKAALHPYFVALSSHTEGHVNIAVRVLTEY
jgi:hypothetical protein